MQSLKPLPLGSPTPASCPSNLPSPIRVHMSMREGERLLPEPCSLVTFPQSEVQYSSAEAMPGLWDKYLQDVPSNLPQGPRLQAALLLHSVLTSSQPVRIPHRQQEEMGAHWPSPLCFFMGFLIRKPWQGTPPHCGPLPPHNSHLASVQRLQWLPWSIGAASRPSWMLSSPLATTTLSNPAC